MRRSLASMGFALAAALVLASSVRLSAAADDQKWGTIKGQVVLDGDVPAPEKINVDKDQEHCLSKGPIFSETWVVNPKNKGVRWAFVYLQPVPDANEPANQLETDTTYDAVGHKLSVSNNMGQLQTFTWNISWGPHFSDTQEFRYWITKPSFQFQVGRALSFDDFEDQPFCVLSYSDANPTGNPDVIPDKAGALFQTRCNVPQRSGRQWQPARARHRCGTREGHGG